MFRADIHRYVSSWLNGVSTRLFQSHCLLFIFFIFFAANVLAHKSRDALRNTSTMLVWRSLLATLVATFGSFASMVTAKSYSCSYTDPILLEGRGTGDFFMEHYANYDEGTITIRLTYDGGDDSWVAIGINEYGGHHMANSIAVIGDVERGVKFYWMTSDAEDASGVWALNDIHRQLQDTSFRQENGQSILEFTMNLAIADEDQDATVYHVISEDSAWIWAAGLPGNQWQGSHRTRGYFSGLVLHDGCELIQEAVSSNATNGESVTETEEVGEDMSPANSTSSPTSTVTETDEEKGVSTSEVASSSSSISISHNAVDESESEIRRLWVSHGILMGIAWGVFAPLAIGAAYLKKLEILQKNAFWLRIHFYLTFSAAIFTVVGFVIAVAATKKQGDLTHFQKDVHHKAGLAIFLLMFRLQLVVSVLLLMHQKIKTRKKTRLP
jgi:hypothetical protein